MVDDCIPASQYVCISGIPPSIAGCISKHHHFGHQAMVGIGQSSKSPQVKPQMVAIWCMNTTFKQCNFDVKKEHKRTTKTYFFAVIALKIWLSSSSPLKKSSTSKWKWNQQLACPLSESDRFCDERPLCFLPFQTALPKVCSPVQRQHQCQVSPCRQKTLCRSLTDIHPCREQYNNESLASWSSKRHNALSANQGTVMVLSSFSRSDNF